MNDRLDWQALINPPKPPRPDPGPRPIVNGGGDSGYGRAALTGELEQLLAAGEGGRNDQLNRSAFSLAQLVASGHLPDFDTQDQLRSAALHIGLGATEVEATLRSAFRAGTQQPRSVELRADRAEVDVAELVHLQVVPPTAAAAPEPLGDAEVVRTSWWALPLADRAARAVGEPAPTHLIRDDGEALLYSGKVNGLIGESESGKSWVALLAVQQAVSSGQRVLILDFEDSPASINRRLSSLGVVDHDQLLDYANPDESLQALQRADLSETLAGGNYTLIVADGINAAMTLLGYDLNSNTDATAFFTSFLRPLTRTGACVLTVDHVPKNPDARGKGGIGAQAKRSMQDGTCLLVEVLEPFGKGQSGELRLTVDKDRNGHVRGISSGGKYAGKAHLDSDGDQVRLRIAGPDMRPTGERPAWRPTGLMDKISRLLERSEQPLSGREIRNDVPGRAQTVGQAITELVAGGFVTAEKRSGRGGGDVYRSVREFREDDFSELVPSGSQVVPGTGYESGSRSLPPYGEGTTSTPEPEPSQTEVVPEPLNLISRPEGWSDCNRCGEPADPETLDETAGYCRNCGRVMNP